MKSKSNFALIVILLVSIGTLAVYGVFFHFLKKEIAEANEKESRIILLKTKDQEIITQKKLIDESKEMRSALEEYFLKEEDIVVFLEKFEALDIVAGVETKISLVSVEEPEKDTEDHPTLSISLDTKGTFAKVYHYLTILEELPYEIAVDQMTLSRTVLAPEEGGLPTWQLSTTLIIQSFIPTSTS